MAFVECAICGQKVRRRRNFSNRGSSPFPGYHIWKRNNKKEICHGFFVEAKIIK